SYVRRPSDSPDDVDSQTAQIRRAEAQHWQATRLKRRQVRGVQEEPVRVGPPLA
ncbi:MAG: hypothetical protein HKO98_15570, partial [Gemmatimonadetes bacterium]|nr:hypothetical protein [Gemmatimonadota bacterium]